MAAMWAGLLLTVVATLAPYVDRVSGHVLADHIRDGYPRYGPERVGHAVTAWLVLLTAAGVLGILGWAGSMWAVGPTGPGPCGRPLPCSSRGLRSR